MSQKKEFNCSKVTISDIQKKQERILLFISMMETLSGAKKAQDTKEGIVLGCGEGNITLVLAESIFFVKALMVKSVWTIH